MSRLTKNLSSSNKNREIMPLMKMCFYVFSICWQYFITFDLHDKEKAGFQFRNVEQRKHFFLSFLLFSFIYIAFLLFYINIVVQTSWPSIFDEVKTPIDQIADPGTKSQLLEIIFDLRHDRYYTQF